MNVNSIISSLSPEAISAVKQLDTQMQASAMVAKKALDAQRSSGEALVKLLQESALQTGKGVNIDILV